MVNHPHSETRSDAAFKRINLKSFEYSSRYQEVFSLINQNQQDVSCQRWDFSQPHYRKLSERISSQVQWSNIITPFLPSSLEKRCLCCRSIKIRPQARVTSGEPSILRVQEITGTQEMVKFNHIRMIHHHLGIRSMLRISCRCAAQRR
jgi:hypothetical protein